MKKLKLVLSISALTILVGCAHPISIAPKTELVIANPFDAKEKLKNKVGFFISPESLNLEVTTPGGGGDNVRYFPYRDLEVGYQKMLSSVFDGVVRVSKSNYSAEFERGGLSYILIPEMITSSGSTGFATWPPTNFSVDLTSKIRDASGKLVSNTRSIGVGSFPEGALAMKGNFGIAGQLAMQDALNKTSASLFETLGDSGIAKKNSAGNASNEQPAVSVESRLLKLRDLLNKKLIDATEYEKKKTEILADL